MSRPRLHLPYNHLYTCQDQKYQQPDLLQRINYYKDVDFLTWLYDEQTELKRSLRPHFDKILYAQDFSKVIDTANRVIKPTEVLKLKPADDESLNTLMLILNNIKGINQGTRLRLAELKAKAIKIREYIVEEYHLK